MKLRKLERKDAELMLEWMHDKNVVENLNANFAEKKIEDCIAFIEYSNSTDIDLHLAIVDDDDIYMGTVSLKHIDKNNGNAEFAVTVRKAAMGKGFSKYGMAEILSLGINELKLKSVFWCVSSSNARAVRFYDKNGYTRVENVPESILSNYDSETLKSFIWYEYK